MATPVNDRLGLPPSSPSLAPQQVILGCSFPEISPSALPKEEFSYWDNSFQGEDGQVPVSSISSAERSFKERRRSTGMDWCRRESFDSSIEKGSQGRRRSEGAFLCRRDFDSEATPSPLSFRETGSTPPKPLSRKKLKQAQKVLLREAVGATPAEMDQATQNFVQNWRWGSDHLPSMATINLQGVPIRVLTQNVLDESKSGMRFPDSSLYKAPGMSTGPTEREILMVSQLSDLLPHFEVVALQECSRTFKSILQEKIRQDHPNWGGAFVSFFDESETVCLYARDYFDLVRTQEFRLESNRVWIQHVVLNFKKTQKETPLLVINVHIPVKFRRNFDSFKEEFYPNEETPTILLGDMNSSRREIFNDSFFAERYKLVSLLVNTKTQREHLTYNCNGVDHILIGGKDLEGTPIEWVPQRDLMTTHHHMVMYATPFQIKKRREEKELTQQRLIKLTEKQDQDNDPSVVEMITDLRKYCDSIQEEIDSLERLLDKHRRVQGGVSLSDFDLLR